MISENSQTLRLFGTAYDSIVDGPGLRFAIFAQGCSHHCPGCHNPESQPFTGGTLSSLDELESQIIANKLTQGITFSGGEPFNQCAACLELATRLKAQGYNLWIYSGYTYEDLMKGKPDILASDLLRCCDVLVDGPFKQSLQSHELSWRGSSNQRVIDLSATREKGEVVLWEEKEIFPETPPSW